MADEMMPVPVEGWARERRLGHFEGSGDERPDDDVLDALVAAQRRRATFQLVTLVVGVACLIVGITALWGWPWAIMVFGMMSVVISVLVGIDFSRPDDNTRERAVKA